MNTPSACGGDFYFISDEELIELVAQTPAAALLSEKSPKTAQGIRANLIAELRFFEFLRDDAERFSSATGLKTKSQGLSFSPAIQNMPPPPVTSYPPVWKSPQTR